MVHKIQYTQRVSKIMHGPSGTHMIMLGGLLYALKKNKKKHNMQNRLNQTSLKSQVYIYG